MILAIFWPILYFIIGFITLIIIKDLYFYAKAQRYLKQGMKLKYYPLVGFGRYIKEPNAQIEIINFINLFLKNDKKTTEDLIITNNPLSLNPVIFVNNKEILKEFTKIETEVTYKIDIGDMPFNRAFIFDKGKRALNNRSIFSEIFFPENLKKITPVLRQIIKRHLSQLKQKVKASNSGKNDGFVEIDLSHYTSEVFTDIVSQVLFGEEVPKIFGKKLTEQVQNTIRMVSKTSSKPTHFFSWGYYRKFGFDPMYNEAMKLDKEINKVLKQVVNFRKNSKTYQRGMNIVDLLLNKNDKLEKEGKFSEMLETTEIIHNIYLLVFAGIDTSNNTTQFSLHHLSKNQKIQQRLRNSVQKEIFEAKKEEDYDAYLNCSFLSWYIKENLRLYSPAWMSFSKFVFKDFKIGKYKFFKGDSIIIPVAALHRKNEYYPNPEEFDAERFDEDLDKRKHGRHGWQPFAIGRRACIGRNLAEIALHMIISLLMKDFEFKWNGEECRVVLEATIALEHCKVLMRCLD